MNNRNTSIDFLRATAIILMTITHVNALLYTGNSPILDIFTTAGATLCFSIFLFCSAYIVGFRILNNIPLDIKNILKRVLEIYIVYIVLGLFITFVLKNTLTLSSVIDIVLLKYVPEFTEFLIAFIIFAFIPLLFYKQIKLLISKPLSFVLITSLIFLIGLVIYGYISKNSYPDILKIPLENIFGYKGLHRFPLTFYLPIYTFGILLSKYNSKKILILITTISILLFVTLRIFNLSSWYRWPPSTLFLLYGYIYIPLILLICRLIKRYISKGFLKIFTNMGKFPLEQFFLSTFFVFIARYLFLPSSNTLLSITINILILTLLSLHPIVFHRKMV